ncbi:MAG: TolC family protein, partial [bacterium]|nr:TolC family protein [bacterium]
LSLVEAVEIAIAKHPSMEAGAARVDAAETRIQQAHSGYLPKVNYQESFARSNNPVFVFSSLLTQHQFTERNFEVGTLNRPDFLNNFQSVVSVDQTVFDAGQTKNRKRTAGLGKEMATEQHRGTRMQLIAGVVRAYHGVVLAAESLKVAGEAVKSATADLDRALAVRQAGMSTDADVLSIRVHLAAVREQQITRQYGLEVARAALNEALGLPLDARHDLTTPLTALPEGDIELAAYEKRAVAERPESRQAELAARMAETGSKAARAAFWPRVSLRGAFEADRQEFIRKGGANWLFGATMNWNLFNGYADKARVQEAVHSLRSANAEKKRADRGIRLEVRKAHSDLLAARERIAVASAAVAHAEESLRITKNRYEAGLNTVTDLLRNETALLESKTRRLAAVYDQRVAAAILELATGSLSVDSEVLR